MPISSIPSDRDGRPAKRVEFSPSLGSIDPQVPNHPDGNTTAWDAETDHLLSYFLGGDTQSGINTTERIAPDFATSRESTSRDSSASPFPHTGAPPSCHSSGRSSRTSPASFMEEEDDEREPPPTPAVQFYSHTGSSGTHGHYVAESPASATLTSTSSSSSLSSMAAALVSGGPVMYQQMQIQQQQQQQQHRGHQHRTYRTASEGDKISPISPAGFIGPGQENLMLPPPGRMASSQSHAAGQLQPMSDQHRHLVWLQDLNARAKAASRVGAAQTGPPQPQHPVISHHPFVAAAPVIAHHPFVAAAPSAGHVMVPGYPSHHHLHSLPPNAGMMFAQVAHMQHMANSPVPSAAETEEKRAKRLERNRESARKSRRRKKERLSAMEAQVTKLQNKIEVERKKRIHAMIPSLTACRVKAISDLMECKGDYAVSSDLVPIIRNTGARSQISLTVTDFQYTTLKQMLLPRYHKVLLWMTLHDETFFTVGKEEYVQREAGKQVSRAATGRISSKQIGDDMTNIPKGKADTGPGLQVIASGEDEYNGDGPNQTSYASDGPRFWPLFCYGLSFSVDQEDRFMAAQKRAQQIPGLAESRAQMEAAQRTTESLKGAVESLCSVVSQREEQTFLSVLNPKQVAAYQEWLVANRERCRSTLPSQETPAESSLIRGKDTPLAEICRKLNEVLQISKIER